MNREAALIDGLLDGGMLLEHLEALLDIQLSDADSARVVIRQPVQLGLVLAAEPGRGVLASTVFAN